MRTQATAKLADSKQKESLANLRLIVATHESNQCMIRTQIFSLEVSTDTPLDAMALYQRANSVARAAKKAVKKYADAVAEPVTREYIQGIQSDRNATRFIAHEACERLSDSHVESTETLLPGAGLSRFLNSLN